MQSRQEISAILLATLFLCVATPLHAARKTTFNPRLAAIWAYNDNVGFEGEGNENSDTSTGFVLTLPVDRALKQGNIVFQYDLSATAYREFESLSHLDHRLAFDYGAQTSRFSSVNLSARYTLTQDQANPGILGDSIDPDPFLSDRTERQTYRLGLGYQRTINTRWSWNGGVSAWQTDFSRIDDFNPGTPIGPAPEDKTGYGATTGVNARVSEKASVGAVYRYGLTELEVNGEVRTHRLDFTFNTAVSKRISLGGSVGGYQSERESSGETESGAEGSLSVNFNDDLTAGPVRFRFGAGVAPSSGGAQDGTSTNTSVFASLSGVRTHPVSWAVETRYSQRRPEFFGQSRLDSTTVSGRLEFAIAQNLGFGLNVRHTHQTGPLEPTRSFFTFSAGPTWYPLGRTRIAGR